MLAFRLDLDHFYVSESRLRRILKVCKEYVSQETIGHIFRHISRFFREASSIAIEIGNPYVLLREG